MDKKILLFLILLGVLILPGYPSGFVSAQLVLYANGAPPVSNLYILVDNIEKAVGFVFGGIAVVCFVLAGVLFLTGQGEPEKIKTARSAVIWGVAGVIVGIVAFSIIAIVAHSIS